MEDEAPLPRPWVTYLLIAINVLVAMELGTPWGRPDASLAQAPTLDPLYIWLGEGHRFITAMFIHGTMWHLAINMWALLQVGGLVEELLGSVRTLALYVVTGVFGFSCSVLAYTYSPSLLAPGQSVGASGAVFGLVGALLVWSLLQRHKEMARDILSSLPPFVALTLLLGFGLSAMNMPVFDNAAHVGGLVAGALLGLAFFADELPPTLTKVVEPQVLAQALKRNRLLSSVSLVVVVVLAVAALGLALQPRFSAAAHARLGWKHLIEGRPALAEDELKMALKTDPFDLESRWLEARLAPPSGKVARQGYLDVVRALDANPKDATAQAMVLRYTGRIDDAGLLGVCDAALHLMGKQPHHEVLNDCAWRLLVAADERVRDPARAFRLSKRAFAALTTKYGALQEGIDAQRAASYLHTLAIAHAENGDVDEAVAKLERIVAQGWGSGWFNSREAFYRAETNRMRLRQQREDRVHDDGDVLDRLRKVEEKRRARVARERAQRQRNAQAKPAVDTASDEAGPDKTTDDKATDDKEGAADTNTARTNGAPADAGVNDAG